ncbi:hypothetical protein M0813_02747 [Anaeramoeba flamelloides]|uniref:Uncharacterized protein n=1 Tax=Anaeramoeba flamelloides TaxID=1746091 RepID=A0ABQ8YE74_9EUKA|nr:hypothetical protein M0813_02747 [Anaeramoeba flamelloides]
MLRSKSICYFNDEEKVYKRNAKGLLVLESATALKEESEMCATLIVNGDNTLVYCYTQIVFLYLNALQHRQDLGFFSNYFP